MNILVTGGLGYIGTHVVKYLTQNCTKYKVIVTDISELKGDNGFKYYPVNFTNEQEIENIFKNEKIDLVIHLASIVSPQIASQNPLLAYEVNFGGTLSLLKTMKKYNVNNLIYFSSSAVYGNILNTEAIKEDTLLNPTTLYGRTKMMSENLIKDYISSSESFKCVILRPFSVVCSSIDTFVPTHINPFEIALDAAFGKREQMTIFGDTYPTKDGTCVRDYIHIDDMVNLCIDSIDYLEKDLERIETINCGTGCGITLLEVANSIKKISNKKFEVIIGDCRQNEMISQVADIIKQKELLNYRCRKSDINTIAQDLFKTYKKNR